MKDQISKKKSMANPQNQSENKLKSLDKVSHNNDLEYSQKIARGNLHSHSNCKYFYSKD